MNKPDRLFLSIAGAALISFMSGCASGAAATGGSVPADKGCHCSSCEKKCSCDKKSGDEKKCSCPSKSCGEKKGCGAQ